MASFATRADTSPIRVVLVGAGGMGKTWMHELGRNDDVELVGVVDLDTAMADAALASRGITGVTVGASVGSRLRDRGARRGERHGARCASSGDLGGAAGRAAGTE